MRWRTAPCFVPRYLLMEYPKNSVTICADPLSVMAFFDEVAVRDMAEGGWEEAEGSC